MEMCSAFEQKVILQYNVYVILCFFHLLLKYDYVGVYRGFQNLFKKLFQFQVCELLVIVSSSSKKFLVVLDAMHPEDDSGEYCGFYHHSNMVEHKNEGERQKCHGYICIYGISVFLPRFYASSRYNDDKIHSILQNHPVPIIYKVTQKIIIN